MATITKLYYHLCIPHIVVFSLVYYMATITKLYYHLCIQHLAVFSLVYYMATITKLYYHLCIPHLAVFPLVCYGMLSLNCIILQNSTFPNNVEPFLAALNCTYIKISCTKVYYCTVCTVHSHTSVYSESVYQVQVVLNHRLQ